MDEKKVILEKPHQNRLSGELKRGEERIVRHRKGTQKVKVMKGVNLEKDTEIKVKDLETGKTDILNLALCHFSDIERS